MCRFHVLFSVFFFKQKTAYEMRISDCSSDVCSSDLRAERARHALPAQPVLGGGEQRAGAFLILGFEQPPIAGARPHALFGGLREREIGRASCRERVCQYV